MKIIDRYVLKTQFVTILLVMFVLLGLTAFINFLEEANKAGTGNYLMSDVVVFVLMKLPSHAVEMFPAATLIGGLLGLGVLASNSELIAMRASGVSIGRLAVSVSIVGFLLVLIATFISEWIAAPAEYYAKQERSRKMDSGFVNVGDQGVWFKDGDRIINIAQWRDPNSVTEISEFIINDDSSLREVTTAERGQYTDTNWQLKDVAQTSFGEELQTETLEDKSWSVNLEPQTLEIFSVQPEHLTVAELDSYIDYLAENKLETDRYEVAMWSRVANLISIFFMGLLSLPFVFGSLRKGNAGFRLFIGIGIGIVYMSANRLLAGTGEVYGLNPFLSATLPTFILAFLTLIMILRSR